MAISHCLEIKKDMSWTLFVHGHKVDLQNCCAMRTTNGNLEINQLVEKIDSLNICAGHPESRFSEITQARKGEFKSSSGSLVAFVDDYCPISLNGEVYDSTIRTVKCELLVNGVKCECCKQYRSTLRSMCHRQNSHKAKQSSAVSSHANYRYLKTPEQRERMSQLKAELDHSIFLVHHEVFFSGTSFLFTMRSSCDLHMWQYGIMAGDEKLPFNKHWPKPPF